MPNIINTYELALKDVNTKSYPVGGEFSNGQKFILNYTTFRPFRDYLSKLKTLKSKKGDLIEQMLSLQTPFDSEKLRVDNAIIDLEKEFDSINLVIDTLHEEIEEEVKRLEVRGIPLPTKPILTEKIDNDVYKINENLILKLKQFWQQIKKWLGVFLVFLVLETFFGLALWDSLRDHKSIVQIILRIAASGVLVITLHLAENKYKSKKSKVYGFYIVYGIFSLVLLLFGSLILTYFFPENLDHSVSNFVFDLNNNAAIDAKTIEKNWIGLFIKYDFSVGLFGVIVYMLISFLDNKVIPIKKEENNNLNTNPYPNLSHTSHLSRLYIDIINEENKLKDFETEKEKLKNESSHLLNEIYQILSKTKDSIEDIEKQISDIEIHMEILLREIELILDQYKIDFLDVFSNKSDVHFAQLTWFTRNDIIKYFNIKIQIQ